MNIYGILAAIVAAVVLAYFLLWGIIKLAIFCFIVFVIYKVYKIIGKKKHAGESVTASGIFNTLTNKIPALSNIFKEVKESTKDFTEPEEKKASANDRWGK